MATAPPIKKDKALERKLRGKRLIVTGCAIGVGRHLAQIYAAHGARIALADILDTAEVEKECQQLGAEDVLSIHFDAGQEGGGARMVATAAEHFGGGLDILVLNHTVGVFSPMLCEPNLNATAVRCAKINYLGYVEIQTAAMGPLLAGAREAKKANPGAPPSSIIAISTLAAKIPMLNTHAYAASKAAITAWFQCLRLELRHDTELRNLIGVSLVYFSAVKTDTLVRALGGPSGPNPRALSLAAEPLDAAWATVRAGARGARDTFFPSSIGFMPRLYALWPWLVRRIVQSVVVKQVK